MHAQPPTPFWRGRSGLILLGFLAIAGFFLWTEDQAQLIAALPWLLLLACPLLHLFMHAGHGGHEGHRNGKRSASPPTDQADGP